MRKIIVEVKLIVPIQIEDNRYHTETQARFDIEGNNCPGTGLVGKAIKETIEKHRRNSTCWGCALSGENKILKISPLFLKNRKV